MRIGFRPFVAAILVVLSLSGESLGKKHLKKALGRVPNNRPLTTTQYPPVKSNAIITDSKVPSEADVERICTKLASSPPTPATGEDVSTAVGGAFRELGSLFSGSSDSFSSEPSQSTISTENSLFKRINASRKQYNLSPLLAEPETSNNPLLNLARRYSQLQLTQTKLSHTTNNSTPESRVLALDITFSFLAENLAKGGGAQDIHDGLMGSINHCKNILSPSARYMTIGVVQHTDGMYIVTEIFRSP